MTFKTLSKVITHPTQRALDWRVGAAFSGSFRGSSQFRLNGVISSLPPASNARRWAAVFDNDVFG